MMVGEWSMILCGTSFEQLFQRRKKCIIEVLRNCVWNKLKEFTDASLSILILKCQPSVLLNSHLLRFFHLDY